MATFLVPFNRSRTIGPQLASMDIATLIHEIEPEIVKRDAETRYRWGDTLAVVILDDGEIGQFAGKGMCSRAQVNQAVSDFLEA